MTCVMWMCSTQGRQASLQDKMLCYPVVVASSELAALTSITMYPAYFHWQVSLLQKKHQTDIKL